MAIIWFVQAIEVNKSILSRTFHQNFSSSAFEKFYKGLGFVFTGEAYLEDNIPHIGMVLKAY